MQKPSVIYALSEAESSTNFQRNVSELKSYLPKHIQPKKRPQSIVIAKRVFADTLFGCNVVRYTDPSGKHNSMQKTNWICRDDNIHI